MLIGQFMGRGVTRQGTGAITDRFFCVKENRSVIATASLSLRPAARELSEKHMIAKYENGVDLE
ncbi:hypothetical protein KIN20_005234 [Parelaphostrongylus tenuis]|uniref:Uncharacterized protein n=1 Tax=Parelaphostrongylus tenuis TaxID=148309 RepID=A0AAD5M485_PARTN|nr:hypothetical protein KIN20_005234 [Parelaphostrongylus tenuis]